MGGSKFIIYFFCFLGASIGAFIPALWGAGLFSGWSVLFSTIGGLAGIYIGYKINKAVRG
jgi:hypothetical protein